MARSNRSARNAGTRFESLVVRYLRRVLGDERIERRVKYGRNDRGDISGVMLHGQRVVIECKDCQRLSLAEWVEEARVEAGNDDAPYAVVAHKRRGTQDPSQQYVTMTLGTFAAFLAGGPSLMFGEDDG